MVNGARARYNLGQCERPGRHYITERLVAWNAGDLGALDRLDALLYPA
jgi:hypothetical protein